MPGVTFIHPTVGTLAIRLAPTSIAWTYTLTTNVTPTYAGEVIQLLGVEIDNLTITGQFGREGPHGQNESGGKIIPRTITEFRDLSGGSGQYTIGLSQMTEYFRQYFAVASQGRDASVIGHYNQEPMKIMYDGMIDANPEGTWMAYPISFPSYKRSNENFAPEWQLTFQVEEPDYSVKTQAMSNELSNLQSGVGYTPYNVFSDPLGRFLDARIVGPQAAHANTLAAAQAQAQSIGNSLIDVYQQQLPAYNDADLNALLFASGPYDPTTPINKAYAQLGVSIGAAGQTTTRIIAPPTGG